ncbi:MAG: hypothetical protein IJW29_06365 [Clostridia bacterium]|nr:hypothetical protein [Clostridia bacterium]
MMKRIVIAAIIAAMLCLVGCSSDDYEEFERLGEPVEIIKLDNFTYVLSDPETGAKYIIDADNFVWSGFDEAYRIEPPTESEE